MSNSSPGEGNSKATNALKSSMSHDDIDAISGMNRGDFGPVSALLRLARPLHADVRLLLAEFLSGGNERGELKFSRRKGRPADPDSALNLIIKTHRAVVDYQQSKPGVGTTHAILAVAEGQKPARSYEAVRADFYEWSAILREVGNRARETSS